MILRKGLGLFFERAIPKSARRPPSTDFSEKTRISIKHGILRISKRSRKHPEGIGTKKATQQATQMRSFLCRIHSMVGLTGLEPATTGPPDRHSKPTELHPVFCLAGAKVLRFLKPAKLFGLFLPFRPKNSTFAGE